MIPIYLSALARCAPALLLQRVLPPDHPRSVVAIGKCAGALLDGMDDVEDAFVAIPEGYRLPAKAARVYVGGHPHVTRASFDAGRALLDFVATHNDITFLISGGGSACVEVAADGVSEDEIIETNARLIASGLPIGEINAARKKLSAIKGGKLKARGRQLVMIYSDVSTGRLSDVASGPVDTTHAILIADNTTLVRAAADVIGGRARMVADQIECDVEEAAQRIAREARSLRSGEVLVAGGEPTVVRKGDGRGGRDVELAVRFALAAQGLDGIQALFASSDGVDGNSGVAGIFLPRVPDIGNVDEIDAALGRSDSLSVATQLGEPIMIAPTGNNLRDLFLVARD
jgi:glycerate-2-kinase